MKRIIILISVLVLALALSSSASFTSIIRGVVKDDAGKTIPNAKVALIESQERTIGKIIGSANSDSHGNFKIYYAPIKPSIYEKSIKLTADTGDKIGFITVINPKATQHIIVYETGGMSGVVKDIDGNPIQNAIIKPDSFTIAGFLGINYMDYSSIKSSIHIPEAVTDINGEFTVSGLPIGWNTRLKAYLYDSPISKPEKWTSQWSSTAIGTPQTSDGQITFIADTSPVTQGGIRGKIYDASDKPMPNATVTAIKTKIDSAAIEDSLFITTTDKDGNYNFPKLKTGEYSLSVLDADQPVPIEMELRVGDGYSLDVPLFAEPGVPVKGKVVDSETGKGIPKVMTASPLTKPATTDKDGVFQLHLLPGDNIILANGEQVGYHPNTVEVSVPKTGAMPNVNIKLHKQSKLYGKVTDKSGNPIDGAWIQPMWEKSPGDIKQSDRTGNYSIVLDDGKSAAIIASNQEMTMAGIKHISSNTASQKSDIILTETAAISGKVINEDGKSINSARITPTISLKNYRLQQINRETVSNENGDFDITGLIVGAEYIIRVAAEGYETADFDKNTFKELLPGKTTTAVQLILMSKSQNN